jgi:CRISPR-associated protein Csb3
MSHAKADITIPVDLTNPGQFFACCGLLELASRLDENALAWFESSSYCISTCADHLLDNLFSCTVEVDTSYQSAAADDDDEDDIVDNGDPHRGRVFPMRLGPPFDLLLNWWTDDEAQGQKLKLWTAGQRVTDLLLGHHKSKKKKSKGKSDETIKAYTPSTREHFADVVRLYPGDWLRRSVPIDAPAAFSFDSRLSRNNALDMGHFPRSTLAFSPAIDVLCLVAFQRFRPETVEVWNRNRYCTWVKPLPVLVAPMAVLGMLPSFVGQYFEFPVKARDSQGRFKLFGHAQPARKPHVP